MAVAAIVIDVNEATFEREVVERSRETPVVVDFWAPWCGPCRVLSPILTDLAQEYAGRFVLAKINVDENQHLAGQFGVQGIPMVKAFRDGLAVAEFVGAQPQPTVRQFIERLLPDPLETQVEAGKTLMAGGKHAEAEAIFTQVLAQDAEHPGAWLGLAGILSKTGKDAEALEALARVRRGTTAEAEADRLRRTIALRSEVRGADEVTLKGRLAVTPDDLDTRFALASLLNAGERYEEALTQYLEIIRRNRGFRDGAARQAVLDIFERLGDDPLVRVYRNKLAMLLFV